LGFLAFVAILLFGKFVAKSTAATNSWSFASSTNYIYSSSSIAIVSSSAELAATSSPGWYNTNWVYRRPITVSNTNTSTLTNFQVNINLTSSTFDFSKASSTGADLFFTDADGLTPLNFWIESYSQTSSTASLWVKVPSISASSTKTIYLYYGNSNIASSSSSGSNTFNLFDDFRTDATLNTAIWDSSTSMASSSIAIQNHTVTPVLTLTTSIGTSTWQGLVGNGADFWAGVNHGDAVNGTIYEYSYASGTSTNSFPAPPHPACGDTRADDGNQIWTSGDVGLVPQVWEINPNTGATTTVWNFSGVDYNEGACATYVATNTIYLFTSSSSYAFDIRQVTLNSNGTYVLGSVWSNGSLGNPNGLKYENGYLWYITGGTPATLYQLQLNEGGSITVVNTYSDLTITPDEPEGLTYDGSNWYYNEEGGIVRKISFNDPVIHFGSWAASQSSYIYSTTTVSQPIVMGAVSQAEGTYPIMLGFADAGGTPPAGSTNEIDLGRFHNGINHLYGRQIEAAAQTEESFASTTNWNTFQKYEIKWGNNSVSYYQNGLLLGSSTSNVPTGNLYPTLGGGTYTGGTNYFGVDVRYVYLRQWANVDPTASVGSAVTVYSSNNPVITPASSTAIAFASLSGFSESAVKNGGEIYYQLSNDDGNTWYWYNGSVWAVATSSYPEADTAIVINNNIASFPTGSGQLLFQSYLHSDGTQQVQLSSVTVTFNPVAPVISSVSTSTTASTAIITWTTDQPSDSQVNYGNNVPYTVSSTYNASYVTSHSVTLTGLNPSTTYHFQVVSSDGTLATSTDQTFTTAVTATSPPSAPSVDVGVPSSYGNSIPITSSASSLSPSSSVAVSTLGSSLQSQLNTLLAELATLKTEASESTTASLSFAFTRNLQLYDTGNDVETLQKYLNSQGFIISPSGAGSPGNESIYFGLKTMQALIKFQKAVGISPASGYFGPITRAWVAAHE
jgi:Domain of unknown function (DUF2341)/Putative peptidoglycan binding domain/Purple acid Phosphatase, N-terminal domain